MLRIKELRAERGLTQSALAALAGIEPSRLSVLERPGGSPRPETLRKLAKAFGVTVDDLLADPAPTPT